MQPAVAEDACSPDAIDIRWPGGKARFTVEVAQTPEDQARGLMFRESMPASAGMLFVFPQPKRAGFWMRNTLIPLDMLFADQTGVVKRIHPDAIPQDETLIDGGEGIKFVLEINGGMADRLRIGEGAQIRHPSIDPSAAVWSCSGE